MKTGFRGSLVLRDLALVGTSLWAVYGCAHAHLERSFPDGSSCQIRSTVLGTGETELATSACGDFAYSTRDTGLSNNGKAALGEIAEGAVRGLVPAP